MQKSEAGEGERKMGLFSSKKQSIHGLGGAEKSLQKGLKNMEEMCRRAKAIYGPKRRIYGKPLGTLFPSGFVSGGKRLIQLEEQGGEFRPGDGVQRLDYVGSAIAGDHPQGSHQVHMIQEIGRAHV